MRHLSTNCRRAIKNVEKLRENIYKLCKNDTEFSFSFLSHRVDKFWSFEVVSKRHKKVRETSSARDKNCEDA